MILTDYEIKEAISKGIIIVDPMDSCTIGPNSIKLTLGSPIFELKFDCELVDIKKPDTYPSLHEVAEDVDGGFTIAKNRVYLAPTKEKVGIAPYFAGFLDGTSNLARLGITVAFSGHIACGFGYLCPGILTLEIESHAARYIRLYTGMQICNMVVYRLASEPSCIYGKEQWHHSGERSIIGSLLYRKYMQKIDE